MFRRVADQAYEYVCRQAYERGYRHGVAVMTHKHHEAAAHGYVLETEGGQSIYFPAREQTDETFDVQKARNTLLRALKELDDNVRS